MTQKTVRELAGELHTSVEDLLGQLRQAGVDVADENAPISAEDKQTLLEFLKKSLHGGGGAAEPKRITLRRRETTELKLGAGRGRGAPTKTINVEVRRRRTFVKRETLEDEAKAAEEAAAAEREIAEREAAARAAAEAEARRQQEEASRRLREEEENRRRSEAEEIERLRKEEEERLKNDPAYRARAEAEAARRRAEENLRRTQEVPRPAPGAAPAGKRGEPPGRSRRKELHLMDGRSAARRDRRGRRQTPIQMDNAHGFEKPTAPVVREIEVPEAITVGELANRMAVKATDLIKVMMQNGVMATINQTIDQDTAVLMVEEMGHKAKTTRDSDVEDTLIQQAVAGDTGDEPALPRPPVVTIMGHVDHGKTTLLDTIRKSRVAAGEAGGITQHIGAYHVTTDKGVVTFLDTPGHAAFTRMRARGAQITDIVVLVVAADDGVMPQTREAIQHARAARAPLVVAITKIDKPEADLEKVKTELSKEEVIPEDWGGEVQTIGVSAHSGAGVDALLDAILVQAEVLELKSPVDAAARGTIVEASIEKGRGPVATVLVRSGTLRQGDVILTGAHFGRVRAMFDEARRPVKQAGPSIPVQVLGLSGAPEAGDEVVVVADERKARELAALRGIKAREAKLAQTQAVRMEQVFAQMGEGEQKSLNLMIKADVQGSAEALAEALRKLPSAEVKINVIAATIGGISESDIDLALASRAIIIGFNVRADSVTRRRIQETGVDVRYYSIIYDVLDDVADAISGLLGTETREQIVGLAEVRDVFRSSKLGSIAGCLVIEGEVRRGLPLRVLRDQVVIYEGELESLRRHKNDVAKVAAGTECGIGVKNYNDVKVGDQIECYERVQVQRRVTAAA
ncbi:MAG: translation initiation factor IF-2 [Gammaproteobacteria bacterium]|nr:translation initiation factor IF-2 [Gammaproteobacteria bacterium]